MVIPVLMSTLVDEGVPSHNMAIILRQGGSDGTLRGAGTDHRPAVCPLCPRAVNGFAAELRLPDNAAEKSTSPTWTIFPLRLSSPA